MKYITLIIDWTWEGDSNLGQNITTNFLNIKTKKYFFSFSVDITCFLNDHIRFLVMSEAE